MRLVVLQYVQVGNYQNGKSTWIGLIKSKCVLYVGFFDLTDNELNDFKKISGSGTEIVSLYPNLEAWLRGKYLNTKHINNWRDHEGLRDDYARHMAWACLPLPLFIEEE